MSEFKLGGGTIRFECEDGHVFEGECTMMSMEIHQEVTEVVSYGPQEHIMEGRAALPTTIEGTFTMAEMTIRVPPESPPLRPDHQELEELAQIRVIRFRDAAPD